MVADSSVEGRYAPAREPTTEPSRLRSVYTLSTIPKPFLGSDPMRASLPLLRGDFPPVRRAELHTLQVNLGYRCNQSCTHCHVNAGPKRTEEMDGETVDAVIAFLDSGAVQTLDITGGAPEMNPSFRRLVRAARGRGMGVIDRCNLTILNEPGYEDLAEFLAENRVRIVASLPCYLEHNVNRQRGGGVFQSSITALRSLNAHGYGLPGSGLELDLIYNPQGPQLPPPQAALEADYKRELESRHGVVFNCLLTLANLPVGRFGSMLQSKGEFDDYLGLLRGAHRDANVDSVMCRTLVSVDWRGYVYDCDFNQMLELPMRVNGHGRTHVRDLIGVDVRGLPVVVRSHCFGCTAGQGSSCGGALSG